MLAYAHEVFQTLEATPVFDAGIKIKLYLIQTFFNGISVSDFGCNHDDCFQQMI